MLELLVFLVTNNRRSMCGLLGRVCAQANQAALVVADGTQGKAFMADLERVEEK
jgi:hypothetical protein